MTLDECFEVPKLEDSILNFQILFDIRNMELKKCHNIQEERVCDTKSGRYYTDLNAYTSKQQVSVHAKCYSKEITSPRCLLLIYLGLPIPITFLHFLVDLVIASHNWVQGKW